MEDIDSPREVVLATRAVTVYKNGANEKRNAVGSEGEPCVFWPWKPVQLA
jgi:hypothetical protein